MAPSAFHAHTDDPLGLATAGDKILTSLEIGPVKDYVELLAETGFYVNTGSGVTGAPFLMLKFAQRATMSYELRSTSMAIPLGAKINTSWVLESMSVDYGGEKYPTVNLTALQLNNTSAPVWHGTPSTYTALGGYGAVDIGASGFNVTTPAESGTISFSQAMLEAMDIGANAGKYLDSGLTFHNMRKVYRLTSYETFSVPTGGISTGEPVVSRRDGYKLFTREWFTYVT